MLSVLINLIKPFALPLLMASIVLTSLVMVQLHFTSKRAKDYLQKYEQARAELTVNSLLNAKQKADLEVSVLQSLNDVAKLNEKVETLNYKIKHSKRSNTCEEAIGRLRDTSDLLIKEKGVK